LFKSWATARLHLSDAVGKQREKRSLTPLFKGGKKDMSAPI
jgi:hypothetical protein